MAIFDPEIWNGNPGAYAFLREAYDIDHDKTDMAFNRMKNNGIIGSQLYIIWSDCCHRDTAKALDVIANNTIEDIKYHINKANIVFTQRGIPYDEE